ncbi:MAG: DUF4091 domain-containing protein [Clostridiales bacterium]|nr:DUF4091 domain-containing protein [Clostridiales bacterium]
MKRILSAFLTILLVGAGISCLPVSKSTASGAKLYATVGNNDEHLEPSVYKNMLKQYTDGSRKEVRSWSGWAWKNDHANSRLDFFTLQDDIPNAELAAMDLTSENGAVIKKENITVTYLATVNTKTPAYPNIDYDVFDIITHENIKDLAAGQIHEAWVDIYVPKDTPAGIYKGTIALKTGSQTLAEFAYELEVIDLTLPNPEDWETYLDLWMYPYASNRYYSGKTNAEYFGFITPEDQDTNPYSLYNIRLDKKYEAGLESELELYHQAGGNAITVTLVEDPWNSRKPCPCPSMVKWTKKADGSFAYDYTDMDYWIELNMKHGINRQINFFYHAGVGYGFVYYDEATGTIKHDGGGGPGSERWKQISTDFLQDLAKHLEEKGWFDIACLSMDERGLAVTQALVEMAESIKNSAGQPLKVGGAVNANEVASLYDRMYDISLWENLKTSDIIELSETRRKNGLNTTLYSCGSGRMSTPNEPGEAAYAVYDSYKYNVDGIMRWALNKYDEDPLHSSLHTVTYPGDCYLIYPAEKDSPDMKAQSTPRFEKLCEGMRNVEKMRIIRKNYPDLAESVEIISGSIKNSFTTEDVARMRSQIFNLSRAVLIFEQKQYTDLVEDEWYMPGVRFAIASRLMVGSNEKFEPDTPMTRAMFVSMLARLDGTTVDNNATSKFKDVPSGEWYTGAVVWATNKKIVSGISDTEFAPNDKIKREEAAALLYRYTRSKGYNVNYKADLQKYKDYDKISTYAIDALSWANAKGIMNGVGDNSLDPAGDCTRAQIAQMLRRLYQNVLNRWLK